jgi:hypothetical protein
MKGTDVCSKNEDIWLEAVRLQVCYLTKQSFIKQTRTGVYSMNIGLCASAIVTLHVQ